MSLPCVRLGSGKTAWNESAAVDALRGQPGTPALGSRRLKALHNPPRENPAGDPVVDSSLQAGEARTPLYCRILSFHICRKAAANCTDSDGWGKGGDQLSAVSACGTKETREVECIAWCSPAQRLSAASSPRTLAPHPSLGAHTSPPLPQLSGLPSRPRSRVG